MGNKNSKPADVLVTDEYTQSYLPVEEIRRYRGGSCDYAALDVTIDDENNDEGSMKPKSITKVLSDANKQNFRLCYVTPKKKGHTLNFGKRLVYNEEEDKTYSSSNKETTHTVILNKAKLSPQSMKQLQLEKMDAQKTIINLMMEPSTKFYTCSFSRSINEDVTKTVKLLESFISEESSKGSRLRSIIHNNKEHNQLDLVLVFSVDSTESLEKPNNYEYYAEVIKVNYKEQKFKMVDFSKGFSSSKKMLKINKKKMSLPNTNRMTNTTCHHEWLDLFREDASIVDVISLTDPPKPFNFKGSTLTLGRNKKRKFQVNTIWVYEKNMVKKTNKFEGLIRQVWTSLEKTLHENIKKETLHFGQFGWNLSTILETPHIRMKMDGSDHNKCVLFFEREVITSSPEIVPIETATSYSTEIPIAKKILETTETSAHVNENDRTARLGMISKEELSQAKLKKIDQSKSQKSPSQIIQPVTTNMLSNVHLKKVDLEKVHQEKLKQNESPVWLKKKSLDEEVSVPDLNEKLVTQKLNEIQKIDNQEVVEKSVDVEKSPEKSTPFQSASEFVDKDCKNKANVVVEADVSAVGEIDLIENLETTESFYPSTNESKFSKVTGEDTVIEQVKEKTSNEEEETGELTEQNLEKHQCKSMLDIDSTYDVKLNTIHSNKADTNLLAKKDNTELTVEGACKQSKVESTPITSETLTPNDEAYPSTTELEAEVNKYSTSVDALIIEDINEIASEDTRSEVKENPKAHILLHKFSEDEGIDTTSPDNEVVASEICVKQSNESNLDRLNSKIDIANSMATKNSEPENVVQTVNPIDSQMPVEFIERINANSLDEPMSEEFDMIMEVDSVKLDQVHAEPAATNLFQTNSSPSGQTLDCVETVNSKVKIENFDGVQSSLTTEENSVKKCSIENTCGETIENFQDCSNNDLVFEAPCSSQQLNEMIIAEDEPGEKEIRKHFHIDCNEREHKFIEEA